MLYSRHAWQNDGSAANPDIVSDCDRGGLRADGRFAGFVCINARCRRNRVNGSINFYIRADQGVVANGDSAGI